MASRIVAPTGANPETSSVQDVTNRSVKAAIQAPAPVVTAEPVGAHEVERCKDAYFALHCVLKDAVDTQLDVEKNGESRVLLLLASQQAHLLSGVEYGDFAHARAGAIGLSALIRASRTVPGDEETQERRELIEKAGALLASITGDSLEEMVEPHSRTVAPAGETITSFESTLEQQHRHRHLDDGAQPALLINPRAGVPRLLAAAEARVQAVCESLTAWQSVGDVGSAQLSEILRSNGHLVEEAAMLLNALAAKLNSERGLSHG